MYIGEFYEKWREAKKAIYASTKTMDPTKLIPVNVTTVQKGYRDAVVRIHDKEGTLLLEQNLYKDK